jgi:thioredoxin-like negative regulator of GroEL
MKAILLATALLALLAPQKGRVVVNVNAKSGEVITGERKFRVTVESANPVTQVEFYVGTELRDKDTSTPYEFAIDGLSEQEGDLKVRFKAYTTEGESGEAAITLKIDNGSSKGVDFHLQAGEAALQESKWDAAINSGRVALRIDPKSNAARMILARGYLGKGDTAQAQKFAEDIIADDANNAAARDLLATINLRAAFKISTSTGGDSADSLSSMSDAFKGAISSRMDVLNARVDAVGGSDGAKLIPFVDAAIRAQRLTAALPPLAASFEKDNTNTAVANRLAYVYLRRGKPLDAMNVLNTLTKYGTPDAYSFSERAIASAELGDVAGSDQAIQDAILADSQDPAVVAAQAYIALKFVRYRAAGITSFNLNYDDLAGSSTSAKQESRQTLQKLAQQMAKASVSRPETFYYQEALNNQLAMYSQAQQAFEKSVLAEPANPDAFTEMGNQALRSIMISSVSDADRKRALATAEVMYNAALAANPTSAQALTGLSLTGTLANKLEDGVRWGQSAVAANPDYAAGHVALATAYSLASVALGQQAISLRKAGGSDAEAKARDAESKSSEYATLSRVELSAAARNDKRLEGQELSKAPAAWRYYSAGGRVPVLPMPK